MREVDNWGIAPDKHFEIWDASRPKEEQPLCRCANCGKGINDGDLALFLGDAIKKLTGIEIPYEKAWYCEICGEGLLEEVID